LKLQEILHETPDLTLKPITFTGTVYLCVSYSCDNKEEFFCLNSINQLFFASVTPCAYWEVGINAANHLKFYAEAVHVSDV